MKPDRKPISTRGKIVMVIVGIVGLIYWLMGKVEVWINLLCQKQSKKEI